MQAPALASHGDAVGARPAYVPSPSRVLTSALLVCALCWAGAWMGTALQFPGIGTALLFPPYAVLTAALLHSKPRRWWIYLLASAVGNVFPHWYSGAPLSFALMAEMANTTRALVAAAGVRRFGGCAHSIFESMKGMAAFLMFACVVAPAVAAFLGAGVVALHNAGSYWLAWRAWLSSNSLTGLTLLPIALLSVSRPKAYSPGRILEAAVLFLALVLVTGLIFLSPGGFFSRAPAALYVPLPLLLWASVRFGPLGTSASLLVVSGLAIAGTVMDTGPLAGSSPSTNVMELQAFLFAVTVPLLLLSSLLREQRGTAEALRSSQLFYQMVVEDQTEMICRFSKAGTLTFVNDAYCKATRRPRTEILGLRFESMMPAGQDSHFHALLATLGPQRPSVTWEHERVSGDSSCWEQWRVQAFFDDAGRLVDHQAVGRDITERKRAQEEHRLLEAQRTLAEVLQEADRRKDEFIAILAHELRNPLSPIAMVVELLHRKPVADEQLVWVRDVLGRQVGQLKRLVDDLLDVSRIQRGTIQLQMEKVDLTDVVALAVETSRPIISERKLEFTVDLPPRPLEVRGDSARLSQLLSNLLNNAAKYTGPGGQVKLSVARLGSKIEIRVRDSGVGIPADMLERVFDPFTQTSRTRDGALGGLGLGLTLVKRLVEMHAGRVEAISEGPDRGSEFVVRLPALSDPASLPLPAPASWSAAASRLPAPETGRRVLVIDDSHDAADSLARFLELQGCEVQVLHDGIAGLEAAERMVPDVVFLDLGMPGLDGLEVARRLRSRVASPGMVLVATTGYGQVEDRRRTAEAGFDYHLTKPVDVEAILSILAGDGDPRRVMGGSSR